MIRLLARNLSQPENVAHGFFGRTGGVSSGLYASLNCAGADARENILENRRRIAATLGQGTTLLTLNQIHGNRAIVVDHAWEPGQAPACDAAATNVAGLALGILTADCAPVFFADTHARVIGVAHAGWKGARLGVVESAITAMESLGAQRTRIVAAIGPCISQANYEVGEDLRRAFTDTGDMCFFVPGTRPQHFQFDLESFVAERLARAGIGSVEPLSACTYARESEFFSFRRATHRGESDFGRQVSAILLCK
jgi:YfiH family protein